MGLIKVNKCIYKCDRCGNESEDDREFRIGGMSGNTVINYKTNRSVRTVQGDRVGSSENKDILLCLSCSVDFNTAIEEFMKCQ